MSITKTMTFTTFHGLCLRTKNVCIDCAFNPCLRMKIIEDAKRQTNKANFGKLPFETNTEIAKRLGISPRQASKMRKRGEL